METKTDLIVHEEEGMALSIPRTNLNVLIEQRKLLKEFIKSQLTEGIDYGRFGKAKKDSLLKPGAEKLRQLFNLGTRKVDSSKTETPEFVSYSYTFEIYSLRTGKVFAQCEGIANSTEQEYWTESPMRFANSISKIAQKRADVGATISATGASDFFTQDMEDMATPYPPIPSPPRERFGTDIGPDIGNTVITFGKYKGQRLGDVPKRELEDYAAYLAKQEDVQLFVQDFINDVTAYLG